MTKGLHLGNFFFAKGDKVMFNKSRFYMICGTAVYDFGINDHPIEFIKVLEDSNPLDQVNVWEVEK